MPRSAISETDVNLLKAIGNEEHINLTANVEKIAPRGAKPPHQMRETDSFTRNAMASIREDDEMSESSSSGEVFSTLSSTATRHASRTGGHDRSDGRQSRRSHGARSNDDSDSSSSGSPRRSRSRSNSSDSGSRKSRGERSHHDKYDRNDHSNQARQEQSMPRVSKADLLFELEKLVESHSVVLSKRFTLDDSYEDIEAELLFHRQVVSDASMLLIMREGLVGLTGGIEMLNNKIGLLSLDGWSTDVSSDIKRYDPVLLRIKAKYLRSTVVSPEMELAFMLGSSAVGFHLKKKEKLRETETRREERKERRKTKNVDIASSDEDLPKESDSDEV